MKKILPDRIHLIASANPAMTDLRELRFRDVPAYLDFVREHLPAPYLLTCNPKVLNAVEDEQHGGRHDDAQRIADLQDALDDPRTAAIVSLSGGAYFTRLLPHLDFSPLTRRRSPLWALGFSELTTLVNLVATYPAGRGLYWLTPNYLGRRIHPAKTAHAAVAEFWQMLPDVLRGESTAHTRHISFKPITGRLMHGSTRSGTVRLFGGCTTVVVAMLAGPLARRLKPAGKWLILEDLQEAPYRIDRHFAAIKLAGWFNQIAGVILGAYYANGDDLQRAALAALRYNLPSNRNVPVIFSHSFGHIWPMSPVLLNQPLKMTVRDRHVVIG